MKKIKYPIVILAAALMSVYGSLSDSQNGHDAVMAPVAQAEEPLSTTLSTTVATSTCTTATTTTTTRKTTTSTSTTTSTTTTTIATAIPETTTETVVEPITEPVVEQSIAEETQPEEYIAEEISTEPNLEPEEYVEPIVESVVETGLPITEYETILLRNVVANEYGSDWVSISEKAKVVAVVMNRVNSSRFPDTIEGVLTQPWQFSGYWACNYEWSTVTQSVRDAVDYYFAHPEEFGGWTGFWGDGTWNHFY